MTDNDSIKNQGKNFNEKITYYNKEIIIDGVDVAGCKFHSSTPSSELCYMKGNKCNDNSNCYYKQLQRKSQELETICKAFEVLNNHDEIETVVNIPQYLLDLLDYYEDQECQSQAADGVIKELEKEISRYKQALEKIEEECEHYKNAPLNFEAIYAKSSIDEIIDIINEVKDAD